MDRMFRAIVTILDRTSEPLRKINAGISALGKPLREIGASFADLARESGMTRLAGAVHGVGSALGRVAHQAMALLGPLAALGGALSIAGLWEMARSAGAFGAAIYRSSQMTGVAAGELARLHYATTLAGGETEAFDKGIGRLNRTIGDALIGKNQAAAVMFNTLKISLRDANGHARAGAEVFYDLAEAVKRNENPIVRAQIAALAFGGKLGEGLIPVLAKGRDELERTGDEFDRLHGKMTDEGAAAAEAFTEEWRKLGVAIDGVRDAIGEALMPALRELLEGVREWLVVNREWLKEQVTEAIKAIGKAVREIDWRGIAAAAWLFSRALGGIFNTLGPVGSGLVLLAVTLAPLIASVFALIGALGTLGVVLLATPIGWILLAIAALVAAAAAIVIYWEPIAGFFKDIWAAIVAEFRSALAYIQPIVDAILAAVDRVRASLAWLGAHLPHLKAEDMGSVGGGVGGVPFKSFGDWLRETLPSGGGLGQPLGGGLATPLPREGGAAAAPAELKIGVSFDDAPPGMKVRTEARGTAPPDVDVGYAWQGGLVY